MIVAMSVSQQIQTVSGAPMTSTLTCTRESNIHTKCMHLYIYGLRSWFMFQAWQGYIVCVMFGAEVLQFKSITRKVYNWLHTVFPEYKSHGRPDMEAYRLEGEISYKLLTDIKHPF